ncbi:hypothetical protein SBA5_800005 [Candidatus Sulfotelmatomonas gaucii]|uniref:Uncharacterized protein n=1 Tax=Candidatus Sulfuritelmatomonas gaucii TaxID=2043161 RepID=A0A2N9M639_9BACT|nr:hypothetical protein SBA5_800005 [Candidatus Sulfotelmatomonas gaucii]
MHFHAAAGSQSSGRARQARMLLDPAAALQNALCQIAGFTATEAESFSIFRASLTK